MHEWHNTDRAQRAERALNAGYNDVEAETNVIDLLADLRHYCAFHGVDIDKCLYLAKASYSVEVATAADSAFKGNGS